MNKKVVLQCVAGENEMNMETETLFYYEVPTYVGTQILRDDLTCSIFLSPFS